MTKNIISILITILYILNTNISTIYAKYVNKDLLTVQVENNTPNIEAGAAILMDIDTGSILYSKNEHEKHYPASITKILTTLLALDYNKPNDIITFSDNAVFGIDRSSSNLAMDVDEQINMTDALYGMMLMSANEVAAAIAEHIAGSIENFTEMMNKRAKEVGALNSNFKNPHGLHNSEHYTTAYDMAMISREAYKLQEFRKIITTVTYQIKPTNKQKEIRYLANQHQMYKNTTYHYEDCTGGKTGFTDEAQSTLVTFAERDGLRLVCVVLNEIGNVKYTDTKKLFDYGFDNFMTQTLYTDGYLKSLPVYSEDNKTFLGDTDIYVEEETIDIVVPKDDTTKIIKDFNIPNKLISPLDSNTIVGTVDFYYNKNLICSTNLKNTQSFDYITTAKIIEDNPTIKSKKIKVETKKINIFIFFMIVILLLYFCFRLYRRTIRRRRRMIYRKRYRAK